MQMITAGYWYDAVDELVETKFPQLQDILSARRHCYHQLINEEVV
jgi:hypothetical protein